jgi:hypothetical protein
MSIRPLCVTERDDEMRYQLACSSLQPRASRVTFEEWIPFLRTDQPVASVEEGVLHVGELADLLGRMWTRQPPKLALLEDTPDTDLIDRARWAELRINSTIPRGCDTRQTPVIPPACDSRSTGGCADEPSPTSTLTTLGAQGVIKRDTDGYRIW